MVLQQLHVYLIYAAVPVCAVTNLQVVKSSSGDYADGPQLTSPARLGPECNRPGPAHLFLLIYGPGGTGRTGRAAGSCGPCRALDGKVF